jgi:SPOR domain
MTYDFSFERKSVAALLIASVFLCALVFFTGLVVGAGWGSKAEARAAPTATQDATQSSASPAAAVATQPASRTVASAAPREPVLYEDPSRREYAAEGYGPRTYDARPYGGGQPYAAQGYGAQGYAAQGGARDDYAAQEAYAPRDYAPQSYAARGADVDEPRAAPREAAAPAATGRSEAARLSARNIDPDPRLVQESDAGGEAAGPSAASAYSVQVGTYLQENEAQRLAHDLEDRGYAPKVFSAQDAEARTWFAVRIGSYASAREAGAAASNFAKQEGRKASVRPSGSL